MSEFWPLEGAFPINQNKQIYKRSPLSRDESPAAAFDPDERAEASKNSMSAEEEPEDIVWLLPQPRI